MSNKISNELKHSLACFKEYSNSQQQSARYIGLIAGEQQNKLSNLNRWVRALNAEDAETFHASVCYLCKIKASLDPALDCHVCRLAEIQGAKPCKDIYAQYQNSILRISKNKNLPNLL